MKYLKVIFNLTDSDKNTISDKLMAQASKDVLCDNLADIGFEAFENDEKEGVTGYVQQNVFDENLLEGCICDFPIGNVMISYTVQEAEDKNWNEAWEETGFEPIVVKGKFIIHDIIHDTGKIPDGTLDITIDTKQAFGTGEHETTFMIVNELFMTGIHDKCVLDCGCGTGILSIVASKLGAAEVTAYDIDEWSVENTRHNCELNKVDNIYVVKGDASLLQSLKKRFDIVLANINRNILLNDMSSFKSVMGKGAILILSGFYQSDAHLLIDCAETLNMRLIGQKVENDWCMLKFEALS